MSEMVERVGRAIDDAWNSEGKDLPPIELSQDERRYLARAVIKAMRDQTLVYRDAGQVFHEIRGAPDDIWKTLLDAALSNPLNAGE